ncbi:hypothetical protein [Streptomyces sp. NPDC048392]|uniref:hypothetical protein n=1 Tax=Streptomyces sp. NPDC048392 TaxID=3365543 RepID=UPI003717B0ED
MTVWRGGMLLTDGRLNDDLPGDWQEVTFDEWGPGALSYAPLRVQKHGHRARLDGHSQPESTFTGSQVAFTIPADLAPAYQHYFSAVRITSGTPTLLGVVVATSGSVTVYSSTSIGSSDRFDFSRIEWPLD